MVMILLHKMHWTHLPTSTFGKARAADSGAGSASSSGAAGNKTCSSTAGALSSHQAALSAEASTSTGSNSSSSSSSQDAAAAYMQELLAAAAEHGLSWPQQACMHLLLAVHNMAWYDQARSDASCHMQRVQSVVAAVPGLQAFAQGLMARMMTPARHNGQLSITLTLEEVASVVIFLEHLRAAGLLKLRLRDVQQMRLLPLMARLTPDGRESLAVRSSHANVLEWCLALLEHVSDLGEPAAVQAVMEQLGEALQQQLKVS
jgi:hypothetical protein